MSAPEPVCDWRTIPRSSPEAGRIRPRRCRNRLGTRVDGAANHLASGEAADPAASAAWTGGPAGVAFVTGSSSAWWEAAGAGGDDPAVAMAAAQRCADAYNAPSADPIDPAASTASPEHH